MVKDANYRKYYIFIAVNIDHTVMVKHVALHGEEDK